jgi:clan AA aspartic protease (TIGR02281 family)
MNWRKLKIARWLRDKLRSIRTSYKYSPWSPRQIRYAIKNKFITKPNKVHVKYFSDWNWTDKSDLIRHLPFVVLVDFIENEDPYTHFDTEDSPHAEGWKELKELYDWYKNRQFEFDAFDYMNEKLGYERTFGSKMIPLERGGVDAWGESAFQTAVMAPELRPKGGSAVIAADSTGRFVTHMQVNGFDTEGVVDFKTSLITLNTNEAKRLGVDVRSASRALASKTGGLAPIYRVKLKQLRIGGITLENIEAVVNEGPNPPVIVLGSNILNRLEVKREGSSLLLSKPY